MNYINFSLLKDYFLVKLAAHLIWILRRRRIGHDLGDWLRAEIIVNWLIASALTVLGIAVLIEFGIRYFSVVAVLAAAIFLNNRKHVIDLFLIAILIPMIGIHPPILKSEVSYWYQSAKKISERIKRVGISHDGAFLELYPLPTVTTPAKGPAPGKPAPDFQPDLRKLPQDVIQNGSFQNFLDDKPVGWGHGLYSDRFKTAYRSAPFWINFLNADIRVSIERTEKGNALKIAHLSETQDHSVGVMEQYIDATPGIYRLTFWAKADAEFENGGLQFFTTDDWRITDKINQAIERGYEIDQERSLEWQQFSGEIQIDSSGKRTFSIVSAKKGTVWITDISFVKIRDLAA